MKKEFHTYIKKAADETSLSLEQQERMTRTLRSYMEMKPIRTKVPTPYTHRSFSLHYFLSARFVALSLVLMLFVSSAGVSYAAEDALPGDILYPVKTQINEPVAGALAVSKSAKAKWAADVAGTRIEEAVTLAAKGTLSTSTQQVIQANFEQHAQIATSYMAQEASTSDSVGTQAAVQFATQLGEYEGVLKQVAAANDVSVATLTSSVQTQRMQVVSMAVQSQTDAATSTPENKLLAIRQLRDAAKKQLEDSSDLAHASTGALAPSSVQDVDTELQKASSTIAAGEAMLDDDQTTPQAQDAFQHALAVTTKLSVFLQTSAAIHKHSGLIISQSDTEATTSPIAVATTSGATSTPSQFASRNRKFSKRSELSAATTTTATGTSSASSATLQINLPNDNQSFEQIGVDATTTSTSSTSTEHDLLRKDERKKQTENERETDDSHTLKTLRLSVPRLDD